MDGAITCAVLLLFCSYLLTITYLILSIICYCFIGCLYLKLVMPDDDEDVPTGTSLVLQKLLTRDFTQISGQTSRLYKVLPHD